MGIGIKELIVILVIVMLVFGTKKIRGIGSDVGGWIRDFKKALKDGQEEGAAEVADSKRVIDGEAVATGDKKNV
jgi:sec-independent protein translocase protein TatA